MEVETENNSNNETIVIEKSKDNYIVKLSNLVIRHLGVFGVEPSFEYADISRRLIIELMKKINITTSYAIPSIADNYTRQLYNMAFSNTFVVDNYKKVHG